MSFLSNQSFVSKTPLLSVGLLELANIHQLMRMWREGTAAGQSLGGWILVNIALWLWLNFYLVKTPDEKFAIWGTALGIVMNTMVILTVLYFRLPRAPWFLIG